MRKKFYRSRENRFLAGVCGGIAEHFDLDPVIVRIIFVLLLMATGVFHSFLAYVLAAIFIPEQPESTAHL